MAKTNLQIPKVIAQRLREVRSRIQQKKLDGYLVTSRRDQYYLTGFDGEDGAVLILPNRVYLITDGRFQEEAEVDAPWATAVVRQGSLHEAIAKTVRKHRLEKLGFDPVQMTVSMHGHIRRAVRPASLVQMRSLTGEMRLIKNAEEIRKIEQAVEVSESAFAEVSRHIEIGMTERELAAELQHEMIRRGARGASFDIIVAEGPNASIPHARPGNRKIKAGSAVLIDWGATVDHYHSDLTRVLFIRRIPPRFRRMYENVLEAQKQAIAAIGPGVRTCDVDARARGWLKQAGMDQAFSHSLGHGLGLEVHEAPRLSGKATDSLRAGMVVTVEPGVYYPGVGGVRIEDDVLVTETGHRVLSTLPRDLAAMVV